jgi:hypothetical protein
MFFRAVALSLALLMSLGSVAFLLADNSEAAAKHHHKKKHKKIKKYSRAWWRLYHARAARKKAVESRKAWLQERRGNQTGVGATVTAVKADKKVEVPNTAQALLPTGDAAPRGWKRGSDSKTELQYRVDDEAGKQIGSASIAVVGPSMGTDAETGRSRTVGGVSTAALRRTVIDQMMKEDGWVVNDYQKDVNGKKVYVVMAQSKGADGGLKARNYYFTEVEGKIVSLATNASTEQGDRIAEETEKVLTSLQRAARPQQAGLK